MHIFPRWKHEKMLNLNVIQSYLRLLKREKRKLAHLLLLFLFFLRFQSFCTGKQGEKRLSDVVALWFSILRVKYWKRYNSVSKLYAFVRKVHRLYLRGEWREIRTRVYSSPYFLVSSDNDDGKATTTGAIHETMPVLLSFVIQSLCEPRRHCCYSIDKVSWRKLVNSVQPFVDDYDNDENSGEQQELLEESMDFGSDMAQWSSPDLFVQYACNVRFQSVRHSGETYDLTAVIHEFWRQVSNERMMDTSSLHVLNADMVQSFERMKRILELQYDLCLQFYSSVYMQVLEAEVTCVWQKSGTIFCQSIACLVAVVSGSRQPQSQHRRQQSDSYRLTMTQLVVHLRETVRVMRKTYISAVLSHVIHAMRNDKEARKNSTNELSRVEIMEKVQQVLKQRTMLHHGDASSSSSAMSNLRNDMQSVCRMMVSHTLRHYRQSLAQIEEQIHRIKDSFRPIPPPKQLLRKFNIPPTSALSQ